MQSYRQSKKLLGHVQRKVNAVGTDHHRHSGVSGKDHDANGRAQSFLVESGAAKDRTDPRTWPRIVRIRTTVITWLIVFVCGYASATDSSIMKRAAATFVVSEFAESFATPMFLFGNAFGALVSGPLSETAGRNFVYLISIPLYMICIMVTALAPSLPVQLVFRFFAGLLASPTLTIYGGSLADMWSDSERSLMWPLFATSPLLGMYAFAVTCCSLIVAVAKHIYRTNCGTYTLWLVGRFLVDLLAMGGLALAHHLWCSMADRIVLLARNIFAANAYLESWSLAHIHQERQIQILPRNAGFSSEKVEDQFDETINLFRQGTDRHLSRILLDDDLRPRLHQSSGVHLHLHIHIWFLTGREGKRFWCCCHWHSS